MSPSLSVQLPASILAYHPSNGVALTKISKSAKRVVAVTQLRTKAWRKFCNVAYEDKSRPRKESRIAATGSSLVQSTLGVAVQKRQSQNSRFS